MFAWSDRPQIEAGVVDRPFRIVDHGATISGVLWRPETATDRVPVVLLGHGGSGHKRSERIVALARWFAEHDVAAVAIDGPFHGDRHVDDYQSRIVAEGPEVIVDRMRADWCDTLDAVGDLGCVDVATLALVGMSMGARYLLPVAAHLGDRLRCAVFGKFGLVASPLLTSGMHPADRIARDAQLVTAPLLFHVQWDDEVFLRGGQLELFSLFGSCDKQLIAYSGSHAETHSSAVAAWRQFVLSRLDIPDRVVHPERTTDERETSR